MGLSVLLGKGATALTATVSWGDYAYEGPKGSEAADGAFTQAEGIVRAVQKVATDRRGYRRHPKTARATIDLTASESGKRFVTPLDGSDGLSLVTTVREVPDLPL